MADLSKASLQHSALALEKALARLDAVVDVVLDAQAQSTKNRETAQAELTHGWQQHSAQLETSINGLQGENTFLKEDNLRLSNQLQQLQRDYLELQRMAEHTVGRLDASVKQLDLVLEH